MAVNKVVFGVETVVDLTEDTVAAAKMLAGTTAHDKSGAKVTGTIQSQAAQTIIPGTANKTIAPGKYLSGMQTIKGDANLIAENIKSGVSIFGVAGNYEGSGGSSGGGSVETCTVSVSDTNWYISCVAAVVYQDGKYTGQSIFNNLGGGTIENVVKGSVLRVIGGDDIVESISGATLISSEETDMGESDLAFEIIDDAEIVLEFSGDSGMPW